MRCYREPRANPRPLRHILWESGSDPKLRAPSSTLSFSHWSPLNRPAPSPCSSPAAAKRCSRRASISSCRPAPHVRPRSGVQSIATARQSRTLRDNAQHSIRLTDHALRLKTELTERKRKEFSLLGTPYGTLTTATLRMIGFGPLVLFDPGLLLLLPGSGGWMPAAMGDSARDIPWYLEFESDYLGAAWYYTGLASGKFTSTPLMLGYKHAPAISSLHFSRQSAAVIDCYDVEERDTGNDRHNPPLLYPHPHLASFSLPSLTIFSSAFRTALSRFKKRKQESTC
ncbi:uncharacterized protein VTP21DRAFT_4195 [Calcarisporiella thermophila]|uniref:uncharacterized protein n=1 Tax=Calcarisporiella thermophila TaxID=911321 RepID=UPI0037431FFD